MFFRIAIIVAALTLSACSSWVFRYDIPQGNYLDKKSIDKLQVDMTKEQVKYILGSPVVQDAFNDDTWNYIYRLKSGRDEKFNTQKKLVIKFVNDRVVSASGDYSLSENFNTPFNIDTVQESDLVGRSGEEEVVEEALVDSSTIKDHNIEPIATEEDVEQAAEDAIEEAELEAETD